MVDGDARCFICQERALERGAACWRCLDPLLGAETQVRPEIVNGNLGRPLAWLLDSRGVLYGLASGTILGRRTLDLAILHPSVSRRHARLTLSGEVWSVADLGSRHGTLLNGAQVRAAQTIRTGDCLRLGPVGFLFALGSPQDAHHQAAGLTTASSLSLSLSGASAPAPEVASDDAEPLIRLHPPIPGGFGSLSVGDEQLALSPLQCTLMEALLERLQVDRELEPGLRGFVSSTELLITLPWETPYPQSEALKQLIRRTRAKLRKHGLQIESNRGLGYRLQIEAA